MFLSNENVLFFMMMPCSLWKSDSEGWCNVLFSYYRHRQFKVINKTIILNVLMSSFYRHRKQIPV